MKALTWYGPATDGWVAWSARWLGALSLISVGAVHLEQYEKLYSAVPTIGALFVLSFVSATVVGVGLLSPLDRLPGRVRGIAVGGAAVIGLALAGIGQAVSQFALLAISEHRPVFGFQEPGYDPTAILTARAAEIATVAFLSTFVVARVLGRRRRVEDSSRTPESGRLAGRGRRVHPPRSFVR